MRFHLEMHSHYLGEHAREGAATLHGSHDSTNSAYWRRPCDDDNKWRRWLDLEVENDVPLTPHCTSSVSQQMDAETDRVPQSSLPGCTIARFNGIASRIGQRPWVLPIV